MASCGSVERRQACLCGASTCSGWLGRKSGGDAAPTATKGMVKKDKVDDRTKASQSRRASTSSVKSKPIKPESASRRRTKLVVKTKPIKPEPTSRRTPTPVVKIERPSIRTEATSSRPPPLLRPGRQSIESTPSTSTQARKRKRGSPVLGDTTSTSPRRLSLPLSSSISSGGGDQEGIPLGDMVCWRRHSRAKRSNRSSGRQVPIESGGPRRDQQVERTGRQHAKSSRASARMGHPIASRVSPNFKTTKDKSSTTKAPKYLPPRHDEPVVPTSTIRQHPHTVMEPHRMVRSKLATMTRDQLERERLVRRQGLGWLAAQLESQAKMRRAIKRGDIEPPLGYRVA